MQKALTPGNSYKLRPAGHSAPQLQREYKEPDRALESAFEEWMEQLPGAVINDKIPYYKSALERLKDIRTTPQEMHALLIMHRDNPKIEAVGIFASAVYNLCDEPIIIYDINDIEINHLGFILRPDKSLINQGTTGYGMGAYAKGPIINYGTTDGLMGVFAKSPIINCGTTSHGMGYEAEGPIINYGTAISTIGVFAKGPIINYGATDWAMGEGAEGTIIAIKNPKSFEKTPRRVLKEAKCRRIPELIKYFDDLKAVLEAGRTDYKKMSAIPPADKISSDINDILWNTDGLKLLLKRNFAAVKTRFEYIKEELIRQKTC